MPGIECNKLLVFYKLSVLGNGSVHIGIERGLSAIVSEIYVSMSGLFARVGETECQRLTKPVLLVVSHPVVHGVAALVFIPEYRLTVAYSIT